MASELSYKKSYSYIFIFFYFVEGFIQGIPMLVFPPYLASVLGNQYDIAQWLIISFIGNIPWIIKLIVGFFNDKWGTKKFGRRFPWIISFGTFGGVWWITMAFNLPSGQAIYGSMALYFFMTQLGMAFADTALDGLILDITPKERLSRVQGYTWMVMLLGMGAGGMLLGFTFLALNMIHVLFVLTGILAILSSIFPYFVKEGAIIEISTKKWSKDLLTIVTKGRNWKFFAFNLTGAIQSAVLLTFFNYVILISMGVINVEETTLSLLSGTSPAAYLAWGSVFYFSNGLGTVIGSVIAGKFGDRSRKKTMSGVYFAYIPFCLISIIPFIFITDFLLALLIGFIFQVIFGTVEGALTVSSQTLRGDISKKWYPSLKSTYFALMISLANAGQRLGELFGAIWLAFLSLFAINYYSIYFIIAVFCVISLTISFLIFRTIDPKEYEVDKSITKDEEVFFT